MPNDQTNVDKILGTLKNNRVIALFIVISIIVIGISTLTDAMQKLWLFVYNENAVFISIRNVWPRQGSFRFPNGGNDTVYWDGVYELFNQSDKPLVIVDFEPLFDPGHKEGHSWQMRRDPPSVVLTAEVYASQDALAQQDREESEDGPSGEHAYSRTEYAPFTLKPLERKLFIFQMSFRFYRDGTAGTFDKKQSPGAVVAFLFGGDDAFDKRGECHDVMKPIKIAMTLTKGVQYVTEVETLLFAPGCYMNMPYPATRETCELVALGDALRKWKEDPYAPASNISPFPSSEKRKGPLSTLEVSEIKRRLKEGYVDLYYDIFPEERPQMVHEGVKFRLVVPPGQCKQRYQSLERETD